MIVFRGYADRFVLADIHVQDRYRECLALIPAVLGLLALLGGCYTNPVTGRSYAVLVPVETERALGEQSFSEVKKTEKVSTNPILNARVNAVGKRIAAAIGGDMPNAQWEFVVFESPEANAFCLPGGKVGVYSGILPICKDDAGLAAALFYAVAPIAARDAHYVKLDVPVDEGSWAKAMKDPAGAILDGVARADAIRWVRDHYLVRAVETPIQEWWVQWFGATMAGETPPPQPRTR